MNFKIGMHVTFTNDDGNMYHGVITEIDLSSRWPINVRLPVYGELSFTLDGRHYHSRPVRLKIRDEL